MNREYLEKRQWAKFLYSLDEGANIVVFKDARDMDSCRSTASYVNARSKDFQISVTMHKEQLVGNFIKVPKKTASDVMTQEEAIRLETMRCMPVGDITKKFMSGFRTADAKRKAAILLGRKKSEETKEA